MIYPSTLLLGFAIFAMFFGSGNLVFPLQIGTQCRDLWGWGFAGLLVSGIILPFAGVFAIKRYHGSYTNFFKEIGLGAHIIVPLILLSLLGAFGVVPRCITVAYGGFVVLVPDLPLWVFAGIFSVICFLTGLKNTRMIEVIGKIMTPIKLVTLALIILVGVFCAIDLPSGQHNYKTAFDHGLVQGYQTMDLIAGFFFSALIFKHIEQQCGSDANPKVVFWLSAKASLIGATVIAVAYCGLVYLGASYANVIADVPPTEMLPRLTHYLLGRYSTVVIALAMGFSCLATATALNNLYADFLHRLFKRESSSFSWILGGTSLISFAISLLDFRGISAFLTPILNVLYPGLIAFTLASLAYPRPHLAKCIIFYIVTCAMLVFKLFCD